MTRPVTHADLVARATGALADDERDRVDRALAGDPALRDQFEAIAAHMLLYDAFPDAPEPPPFEQVAQALHGAPQQSVSRRDLPRAAPRRRRAPLAWTAAAAAILLAAILVWRSERDAEPVRVEATAGAGIEVLHEGAPFARVAAGETMGLRLPSGALLRSRKPAEVILEGRVVVVLDGDSPLRVEAPGHVRLTAGRAHFQVGPGPFRVDTPYGPVEVLGTRFEVDLRYGALSVHVEEGVVMAQAQRLETGARLLADGSLEQAAGPAGTWFQEPLIELTRVQGGAVAPGQVLELQVDVVNPNHLRLSAPGPASDRTGLYAVIQRLGPDGRWQGLEQPLALTEANILSGESVVRPGQPVILGGGERRSVTLQLLSPFADPGTYRVRVGYHPEGRSPIVSAALEIEVAR
ncbi:MAG: FecR family protein [Planctomycetota bacterium]|nr:FecR family protein [Planctomycetota bacterium]